jgi:hypothetical protein
MNLGEFGPDFAVDLHTPNLGPPCAGARPQGGTRLALRRARGDAGEFTAPHTVVIDSRGDLYVGEVSYTSPGQRETPPREIRSLQKFRRTA